MAHKTFSQEQLQFQFFNLVISFTSHLPAGVDNLTINQLLYVILQLKSSIPFVETNFFLLKKFQIKLPVSDFNFLKL